MTRYQRAMRVLGTATWFASLFLFLATLFVAASYWERLPPDFRGPGEWALVPLPLTFTTVGVLIVWRRPANRIGRLLCLLGLFAGIETFSLYYSQAALYIPGTRLPAGIWALWATQWAWAPEFVLIPTVLPALFPNGRLLSPRWRPFVVFCLALMFAAIVLTTFVQPSFAIAGGQTFPNPTLLPIHMSHEVGDAITALILVLLAGAFALGAVSLILRWRRAGLQERQQVKWFSFAMALIVITMSPGLVLTVLGQQDLASWLSVVADIGLNAIPIAIGFAVLRYRLFDIDVLISRSLVYVSMAVLITAIYVAVVVGVGALVGATAGSAPLGLAILATALVAVAFEPARERLQRLANHIVYGDLVPRYQAVAQFGDRLSHLPSVEEALPTIAEAAQTILRLEYARATLFLPSGAERTASSGNYADTREEVTVPVTNEGERLGELFLQCVEPLTEGATDQVIRSFAQQAGVVFRNVRLTLELQERLQRISELTETLHASRHRIVTAADVQRRRLEGEIRATTAAQLTSIAERLREVELTLPNDQEAARHVLDSVIAEANDALEGLRELARGVFPPLLIDKGIVAALQAHIRRVGEVALDVDPEVAAERFDAPVEAALYFSCVEALRGSSRARISLHADGGWLACRVEPMGPEASILDIRDRVEALGGSTEVDDDCLEVKLPATALELAG